MNSKEYWQKREEEALKIYIKDEAEYSKELDRIYADMLDNIEKEIDSFYQKYASAEGITLAEAKKRVSKLDIDKYERKAAKYVKDASLDRKANGGKTNSKGYYFSDKANAEMRLYNATMKINRLEMLKANIGLETIKGHAELESFMEGILKGRTEEELARQAGILGKTVRNNAKMANAIVNGSFKVDKVGERTTFSDRIWQYHDEMKNELSRLLSTGLIQGKNSRAIAKDLKKYWYGNDPKTNGGARYCMERLMRTEMARVQTEAQKQSFIRNGFEMYTFHANRGCCDICSEKDGEHFEVSKMMPGENAPPMHPHCRCSVSAYEDSEEYEAWLDYLANGGTTEQWEKIEYKPKSNKMASLTDGNDWSKTEGRKVSKKEKAEIVEYANSLGVNIVDLSRFDGDTILLKSSVATVSKLKQAFKMDDRKITIGVSDILADDEFASTTNETITFNAKSLRDKRVTAENLQRKKGEFAAQSVDDIAAHEFGHIISAIKGNKGIEIAQNAYYNVYKEDIGIDETIEYIETNISEYAVAYSGNRSKRFNPKKYKEIIPEIVAKNNSNADDFTTEFVELLKGV